MIYKRGVGGKFPCPLYGQVLTWDSGWWAALENSDRFSSFFSSLRCQVSFLVDKQCRCRDRDVGC